MRKESSDRNWTKIGVIIALLALIVGIISLIFDNGLFWRFKEHNIQNNKVVDDVSLDSDTSTNDDTVSNYQTDENTEETHLDTPRIIVSNDNQCAQEAHGLVKNEDELSGFIYWNESNTQRSYCKTDDPYAIADDQEPLHHIYLDLSKGNYLGMAINISLFGDSTGVNMMQYYDGGIWEFYISEGHFTITAEIWEDDNSTYVFESMDVIIDHCGLYSLQ